MWKIGICFFYQMMFHPLPLGEAEGVEMRQSYA